MTSRLDVNIAPKWFEEVLILAFESDSIEVVVHQLIRRHSTLTGATGSVLVVRDPLDSSKCCGVFHRGESSGEDEEMITHLAEIPSRASWQEVRALIGVNLRSRIDPRGQPDHRSAVSEVCFVSCDGSMEVAVLFSFGLREHPREVAPMDIDVLMSVILSRIGWRADGDQAFCSKQNALDRILHRLNGACAVVALQGEMLRSSSLDVDRVSVGAARIVDSMSRVAPCLRALESLARSGSQRSHSSLSTVLDVALVMIAGISSIDVDPALRKLSLDLPPDVLAWIVLTFLAEAVSTSRDAQVFARASKRPNGLPCQVLTVEGGSTSSIDAQFNDVQHRLLSSREILDHLSSLFKFEVSWGLDSTVDEISFVGGLHERKRDEVDYVPF